MTLPLAPPIAPQLARAAKELPEGPEWAYEPKWDGFRVLVFADGDEAYLQSRGSKPLSRYFPELVLPSGRYVLDGEIVIDPGDGGQDFAALQQRIHPAVSRIERLAAETPAKIMAFDLLALGDEVVMERPLAERRTLLEGLPLSDVLQLTPQVHTRGEAERWLHEAEGVIAKRLDAAYAPGKRTAMQKIRRTRTIDCVIVGFRPGNEPETVGSLILALYEPDGKLSVMGHSSGFSRSEKRSLRTLLAPLETGRRGTGDASRWTDGRELEWVDLEPVLVCEVTFDHQSGGRIRHGARLVRMRDDREPESCRMEQLDA